MRLYFFFSSFCIVDLRFIVVPSHPSRASRNKNTKKTIMTVNQAREGGREGERGGERWKELRLVDIVGEFVCRLEHAAIDANAWAVIQLVEA